MNAARWSVVITTRNRAQMLKRAVESCIKQTVPCEILVVDEASTDETAKVVKEFPEITYIRNGQPLGHATSANKGIKAATAEWIKPLDDDDWLAPDCIEIMTKNLMKANLAGLNPVLISGNAINVGFDEVEIGRTRPFFALPIALSSNSLLKLMMLDQAPIGTPAQVGHNREVALRVGGWNEQRSFRHQHGDEIEFWIRLAAEGDAIFVPDFVSYRTIWAGGSQQIIPHDERYRSNVYLKDKIAIQLGIETPQSIKRYLALHWAIVAAKEKNYIQAAKLGWNWMHYPLSITKLLNRRSLKDAKKLHVPIS
jgi:glycosyltransferase involved in cell wall biosynthesis